MRFRNPESTGYYNPAWSAVFIPGTPATPSGFEVQIDNTGVPNGRLKHKTGALYAVNYPNDLVDDTLSAGTDARRFRKALPTRRNFNDRS